MSKIFRQLASPIGATQNKRLLARKAAFLSAALLILWLLLQLAPRPQTASTSLLFSDDSGTVAVSNDALPPSRKSFFSVGNSLLLVTLLILVGLSFTVAKKKKIQNPENTVLKQLDQIVLSEQHALHLIQFYNEHLLVACSPEAVSVLKQRKMSPPPITTTDAPDTEEPSDAFSSLLNTISKQTGNGTQVQTDEDLPA